ncbi:MULTISPECIES: bifunctional aconitate hydratase 2/2-methylisocitrate dehydratase [Tenacibaculum]|uniref:Bifunctional aconitate hydratase 2/2-methylisocitrate dehydratase n=2 Tax=Tenacibaculum TaxID=104267 RepID=A0AAE9MLG1_9FLAO|nr:MULTISPECIES: bifunctional aconitate hydratase 2/2-methylisocitrate dehydratase [Tenacibaculum]GFD76711.1 aconitate hydratase [Tenacibaculum sp. KUL113]GFD96696.1 aconitate hydratase [Alteromonas sp. KUL154]GFE00666.1 aconitate hydratase [Alteromonas sp. KUL156]AZJ31534.1 bifunctional aconitate hydratase 2/2-methylisocitrate dehydratase [Tenacibaculum mesophilum]MCG7502097.1 bifunctional aconitate hydratase 2/2-methylisocitrate dehydratase [Tenacibaculum sp. Mcav3-52]|eukprot:TRINITY_DN3803_c0_g1_i3.p1 TRINITY_DN3803_c0_g1~~TRINITY_DN3803_c0_g1_i3.p1  ORF type:complete len:926 (-),score=227.25 TRINITY_DN3803_c0_g1_i3:173-2950(-)
MNTYSDYLKEIEVRKGQGLHPKPIDGSELLTEIISQIKDVNNPHRKDSLNFFIYNVLPGTTSAAGVKANFLKEIILGESVVEEITPAFAFEQLGHMKGGPSVEVLLDLALGNNADIAVEAAKVLKTQVFLYEADTERLEKAYKDGNVIAKELIESYAKAEFFTKLPEVEEEIKVVTFVAGVGDISTDLLSPGADAHSRSDRELHGQSIFEHDKEMQQQLLALKEQHPDKRVMLIAEKGTMGVGSSRMSGVNNVALWTGVPSSPYVPFINIAPVIAGTNGIAPIFLTTVGVTGGIGIDLKNWVKQKDENGNTVVDKDGEPILKEMYSVKTGTVLTINTKEKKLYNGDQELKDISTALTPQKMEFIKAGGSYAVVFGKKLQTFACKALGIDIPQVYAASKEISIENQGLTAVEKIFNKNAVGTTPGKTLHAGSNVRVEVNIVGSQDTTGLMTSQELEMMAATVISPIVDAGYQSGCHTASVWDDKSKANIPRLMKFMNDFGLITGRDPKGQYHAMTDVIHKVLNDITVDDWDIIIGGDSHTRMSKGVAFGADSGTVALALATGEATMPIPESVKVTFKGNMRSFMDFRDVVHATQQQMLKQFDGENVFQGRVIEVHIGTLTSDQAFTFTDWTAEMKAKASICISEEETLIESLEIARDRIQIMIDKGMDNEKQMLQGLVDKANNRIQELKTGTKPALKPDADANYYAEVVIDLDEIAEPMIADPDVNNEDVSKRYTHDTIRPLSFYGGTKKVDLGFVGSCMVHKGDMKILAQMLKNIESQQGEVKFNAPLVVAPPTYNIVDELKAEGDWEVLQKYSGFEFDDNAPKGLARTKYENMLYLERPGCNLCMGNQEKAEPGDTVMATSTRLFQGRVVKDSGEKKGESLLSSTPVVVLSTILGRTPTMEEYEKAVDGIVLTKFKPSQKQLVV